MNDLIKISQFPVIEERLRALKSEWEQKATDAAAMVCTEDTIQGIKAARAEMRREFEAAETQRKAVRAAYMEPWNRIEAVYRECVADAYARADAAYKTKIAEVEDAQKAECEERCRAYFAELRVIHCIPWLRYEDAGLKISLTEAKKRTPSGHFDKLSEFVARVACDVDAIADDAELMAEYKGNGLNLARAQKVVRDRREAAVAERKAAEERAEAKRREAEAVAKVEAAAPVVVLPPVVVETPAPVGDTPPVEVKMLTVKFKATATREKLIKLREFMKVEGIRYE